jgi:hypothetical protein
MREHGAWIRINRRAVNAINGPNAPRGIGYRIVDPPVYIDPHGKFVDPPIRHVVRHENKFFVDLTTIRERFEPRLPELSAMEEARAQDRAEQWQDWKDAVLWTMALVLALAALVKAAWFLLR